jgi:hypothetical protein
MGLMSVIIMNKKNSEKNVIFTTKALSSQRRKETRRRYVFELLGEQQPKRPQRQGRNFHAVIGKFQLCGMNWEKPSFYLAYPTELIS